MSETKITCPSCKFTFEFTAAMRAGIEESVRRGYQQEEAARGEAMAAREMAVAAGQKRNSEQAAAVDALVKERAEAMHGPMLAAARAALVKELAAEVEAAKVEARGVDERRRAVLERELAAVRKAREEEEVASRERVGKAQEAELAARREKATLEEEMRGLELTRQRELGEERARMYEKASTEEAERSRLKLAEKEKLIGDLQRKTQEMQRTIDTTSQQLQGEVQELDLEGALRRAFPRDTISPVPKGQFGGDALHEVAGPGGQMVGTILWESKRTKAWSDGWLGKLKGDQRAAKADVCALVSATLPKGMETFGQSEQVWISSVECAVPLAAVLRQALIDVAMARASTQGRASKVEMVYEYLTGKDFRNRIEAIREAYEEMREDLEGERKVLTARWNKREKQIQRAFEGAVGLYGDLQGIAGKGMGSIEGFELRGLES